MAGKPAAGRAYLAARQYQLAPGHTMEELAAVVESGFLPILRQVPGFLEYFLVETDEGLRLGQRLYGSGRSGGVDAAGGRLGVAEPGRVLHRTADGDDRERLAA